MSRWGWSIGDAAYVERDVLMWLVTVTDGESWFRDEGPTLFAA